MNKTTNIRTKLCFKNLAVGLFLISSSATAAVTISSVTGASAYVESTTTTTSPSIFAGFGGDDCSSTAEAKVCNSCVTNELKVCNAKRVYPALQLRIEYKDSATAGKALVTDSAGTSAITLQSGSTSSASSTAGSTQIAIMNWSDVCPKVVTGNDCTTSFSGSIKIGVDSGNDNTLDGTPLIVNIKGIVPDGTLGSRDTISGFCDSTTRDAAHGICAFNAYPGDEKIYLEDVIGGGNFPLETNTQLKFVRVIYSSESFNKSKLNPHDAIEKGHFADLPIGTVKEAEKPELSTRVVEGLTNNTLYYFRVMVVDEAGNMSDITDDTEYTSNSDCASSVDDEPADSFACPLTATPDEVVGLLNKDMNCFISTVAYGSTFADKVNTFREFRHRFLLPHSWGRKFNILYYQYGSQLSQYIAQSEVFKAAARVVLFPIWMFARLALDIGVPWASFLCFLMFGLLAAILTAASYGLQNSLRKKNQREAAL